MSTRRDFLKTLASSIISSTSLPVFLASCTGLSSIRAQVEQNRIVLARSKTQVLTRPNGILLVNVSSLHGTIILRNLPEFGIIAVSSICSHRGCEVRAMPHSLQCPCHGSEYDEFGDVLEGPATRSLKKYKVKETAESIIIEV